MSDRFSDYNPNDCGFSDCNSDVCDCIGETKNILSIKFGMNIVSVIFKYLHKLFMCDNCLAFYDDSDYPTDDGIRLQYMYVFPEFSEPQYKIKLNPTIKTPSISIGTGFSIWKPYELVGTHIEFNYDEQSTNDNYRNHIIPMSELTVKRNKNYNRYAFSSYDNDDINHDDFEDVKYLSPFWSGMSSDEYKYVVSTFGILPDFGYEFMTKKMFIDQSNCTPEELSTLNDYSLYLHAVPVFGCIYDLIRVCSSRCLNKQRLNSNNN